MSNKTFNQLVDNSTIKEVSHFLFNDSYKINKNNKKGIIDNLLLLTHSAIVGDKINYIEDIRKPAFLEDENILQLNSFLNKKLFPLQYDKENEDKTILEEAKRDVKEYIHYQESFSKIFKKDNFNIIDLMDEEIKMYLNEGFDHYWTNIGWNKNGEEPKPTGLYSLFKYKMDSIFAEVDIKKIDCLYDTYYKTNRIELYRDNSFMNDTVKEHKWLPLLSHIVRSQYYITIATKEDVYYNPLNTRKYFSNGLLETALNSKENETKLSKNNHRMELLFLVFRHLLEKSNYNRKDYLKTLTDLIETDKENIIKDVSYIYRNISLLNFMYYDNIYKKELEKEILNLMKVFFIKYNYKEQSDSNKEFITKLSEEEKERINTKDDINNFGVGTILITNNEKFINKLGGDFNNKFLK